MKTSQVILSSMLLASVAYGQEALMVPKEARPATLTYTLDKETTVSFTSLFGEKHKNGEIKVIKGGKEIQKFAVPLFAPPFEFHALSEGSFGPGSKAIGLTQSYEACDYPSGETVFIWDGKNLVKGPDVHVSNGDGMIVSFNYELKWMKNCLQVDTILKPDMSVEGNKGRKSEVNSEFYAWDGKSLNKSKSCPK